MINVSIKIGFIGLFILLPTVSAKLSVGVDNQGLSDESLSLDLFYSFFFIDLKLIK